MTLDDWFGPREESEPYEPKPTDWPRVQERLRWFLDEYQAWVGFRPEGAVRTLWRSGVTAWVDQFGEATGSRRWFRDAMDYCDRRNLKPKGPAGLLFYGLRRKTQKHSKSALETYGACPECFQVACHAEDCPNA